MRGTLHAGRLRAADWRRSAARWIHRRGMKSLGRRQRAIAAALERDGATVVTLDELAVEGTPRMLGEARGAVAGVERDARMAPGKSYFLAVPHAAFQALPGVVGWGLSESLLDIVEHYLGQPVFYRGVVGRRELPDGQAVETRLFHRDAEDVRSVKIIVYLNDVPPESGPFEYVPRGFTPPSGDLVFRDGRVSDEEMARHAAESHWVRCEGPAGTVVIADTCSVYHRGRVPVAGHRDALFFAYNSSAPTLPDMAGPIFDFGPLLPELALSERQRAALTLRS